MNKSKLKKITSARLFLPIVCLIAVLLLNVIKTPDFFNVSIRNGVLYGYIIDVINRASEPYFWNFLYSLKEYYIHFP